MKKRKLIGIIIASALFVVIAIFGLLTRPIEYKQSPDPLIYNKDTTNTKQRPFIVDKNEYPFKSNWYERDGTSMHYIDEGEGIPVVLCHGNPDWSFLHRNIIKELKGECRVISFDLPGFGFSDTPPNYGFTPKEHAEWVNALITEHLKLNKYIIMVQDWGGPIGLSVATEHPENILGVVISNTWAWKSDGGVKWFSYGMRTPFAQRLVMNLNYFATDLMPSFLKDGKFKNKAVADAYINAFPTVESRKGTAVFPVQITKSASWLEEIEGRLHTLKSKPIEFIFGQQDFTLGKQATVDRWRTHYPNANYTLLPDVSHFTPEDSPESFSEAIRNLLAKTKVAKK